MIAATEMAGGKQSYLFAFQDQIDEDMMVLVAGSLA